MGLEVQNILSDERHYGAFLCAICTNVVGLKDCVVTNDCSHVFCASCLSTWMARQQGPKTCPTCHAPLLVQQRERRQEQQGNRLGSCCSSLAGAAQPLQQAQPVAHRLLASIKVSCPFRDKHSCPWVGDYADLQAHLISFSAHVPTTSTRKTTRQQRYWRSGKTLLSPSCRKVAADTVSNNNDTRDDEEGNECQGTSMSPVALAESFKQEAFSRFECHNFTEARDLYTRGIFILSEESRNSDQDSLLATLLCNRAAAYLRLQRLDECIADCSKAIQLNPAYAKAYVRRSKAQIENGQFEAAYSGLQQGCAHNSESTHLCQNLVRAEQKYNRMQQALQFLKNDEYASAKSMFTSLLGDAPDAPPVLLGAAQSDICLGLTNSALRFILQVLRNHPQNSRAYLLQGKCKFLAGAFENAKAVLRQALRFDPDSKEIQVLIHQVKAVEKKLEESKRACVDKRFQHAIDMVTAAIASSGQLPKRAPLYGILLTERAEAYSQVKQFAKALHDCRMATNANDDNERAWLVTAKALHGLGQHEKARNELEALLARWGSSSPLIRDAFKAANLEVRKSKRPNLYALLGISSVATKSEIKKQYKAKAMEHHPDRWSGERFTEKQRQEAEEKFKLLGEALDVLLDSFKRQLYDEGYDLPAIRERVAEEEERQSASRQCHPHD